MFIYTISTYTEDQLIVNEYNSIKKKKREENVIVSRSIMQCKTDDIKIIFKWKT